MTTLAPLLNAGVTMRYAVAAVLALLCSVPVFAQRSFDLTGNVVWLDPTGGGTFGDLFDPVDLDVDSDMGYGIAANVFFSDHLSAEFAVARVDNETNVRRRATGAAAAGGNLEMTPLTAVLQYHFAPNAAIDPYLGAGGAYMLFDFSEGQGITGVNQIDVDDDIGFAVNAGIGIKLGGRLGLNVDAKYVPVESSARAIIVSSGEDSVTRIDVSPIIISAGLSLRF
jgi:outer membrane protein